MVEKIKSLALSNGYELTFDEVLRVMALLGGNNPQESCTDDDYLLSVYIVVGADIDWVEVKNTASLSHPFTVSILSEKIKSL
jgi:hypothetical protein